MRRLVELTLRPDLTVDEAVAGRILGELGRRDLRRYAKALKRAVERSSVRVAIEGGDAAAVGTELGPLFPGRHVVVTTTRGTGGGLQYVAGDDVLDASVTGYLRAVLQELHKT